MLGLYPLSADALGGAGSNAPALLGEVGAFTLTGQAATTRATLRLISAVRAFALAGQDATLLISERLLPDSTVSNTGWSPVNAATIWQALAVGDTDYITASTATSVTEVSVQDPPRVLVLTNATFTFRARAGA